MKYQKLSRDKEEGTKIMAGHTQFTIKQLENEIKTDSPIGRKLKSIEKELEQYWKSQLKLIKADNKILD